MSLEKEEKEDWMKKAYPNSIRIEVKKDKKDLS